jgi:hypothetical protein
MRKISSASVAMIMGVALYFTMFWGFDALRMLTSPTYGLEDVWRSQFVFGIGRVFGLSPMGLIQLSAFFGVVKLAVALICAVHLVDRLRALAGGKANAEVLEGGLLLVVLTSIAAVGPAMWSHNTELAREQIIPLALAGIAIALCMVERRYARPAKVAMPTTVAEVVASEAGTPYTLRR